MNNDAIIHALSKYYTAGFEFLVFNVTENNKETAKALSNFFEVQDSGVLVLNYTTPANQTPDFSFIDTIKENRSTKVTSLPANLDPDSVLGTGSVGKYASRGVGANFKFMQDIPSITPQDEFNFTPEDLKPYEKYNIATFAYEAGIPMITNGKSLTGLDVGALVVRDSIRQDMMTQIGNFLYINNVNVPYDEQSINAIKGMESGILTDYKNRQLIENPKLNDDNSTLDDETKATGIYQDAGYSYTPMRSIDQVKLTQTLNITKEE